MSHSKKKRPPSTAEKFLLEAKNPISQKDIQNNTSVKVKPVADLVDLIGGNSSDNAEWRKFLRKSLRYKQLKKEFSDDEVELFESKFLDLVKQFREDLLSSEIDQMFHLIKIDLLMSRNLEQTKNAKNHIYRLEQISEGIVQKHGGDLSKLEPIDRDQIIELEKQVSSFRSVEESANSEYVKLDKAFNDILKTLKATREQRSKSLNDAKVSFTALVKLLQERDIAEKENRQLSLFQHAADKEKDRLSELTQYMDNTLDHPLLNADTVLKQDEIEKQEDEVDE